jgi:MFS family permease
MRTDPVTPRISCKPPAVGADATRAGVIYTGRDRVRAISVYGMTLGLAAVGGQLIGGILIRWDVGGLGWRLIFLINVPVGIAALSLIQRLVPESRAQHARRLDPIGMTLVTLALAALVLPLVEGPQVGWPTWTWLCLGLAAPWSPCSCCTRAGSADAAETR